MSFWIADLAALEILDSRGRPTVQVRLTLEGGAAGVAGVPSGASTGAGEAVERRDGEPLRYGGLGVTGAVAAVNGEIRDHLTGSRWASHADVDRALIELDGTQGKARLGANAIVGVSMALARALADLGGLPLYAWLAADASAMRLPVPHFNVLNGGAHAANPLEFQEFMIAPLGAPSLREAVRAGAEVYAALRRNLTEAGQTSGLGDEGGFAPDIAHPEQALDLLVGAIADAGYRTGRDGVAIALDPAANGFHGADGRYRVAGEHLTATELIDYYDGLMAAYPIWSIEDGVAEDDDAGWAEMTVRLGEHVQIVGDDNFVTDSRIIAAAIDHGVANAALIKVNQIGTVTETLAAIDLCRTRGYGQMISHRSGETPDTFIADLAVACGCGQIKSGAPARGERVAKYNRLLEIAAADPSLPYGLSERQLGRVHEGA